MRPSAARLFSARTGADGLEDGEGAQAWWIGAVAEVGDVQLRRGAGGDAEVWERACRRGHNQTVLAQLRRW